ncbi:MAG: peptidylprolyl isomerase [Prevotellaceae bacterium]|jgi:peptidyl-prolyl cis-trans isomerase B (cyclophilin B)|nr:peptidylprolyl isomerase [Prevotellaceae bacterium]
MKRKLLSIAIIAITVCACNSGKKTERQSQQTETQIIKEEVQSINENETVKDTAQKETQTMEKEVKKETTEKVKVVEKAKTSNEPVFDIVTSMGTIRIKLYKETPKHRDNFVKLATSGYYDGILFHRVIKDFMIQTGDPDSKNAKPDSSLGIGGPDYKIDAEILPQFKHKKGTIAAARQGDQINPEKKSSGSQFYIVHNQNGTPHLDGAYTIFGETISGLDVIDKIATAPTGRNDRPVTDIKIEKIIRVE